MTATEEQPMQQPAPEAPRQEIPPPQPEPPPTGRWRDRLAVPTDPRRKSPLVACLLSAMPGLGQVYVGYYRLGFIHMVVFGATISILAEAAIPPLIPLLGIFLPFFVLYNIIDAGRRAIFYNQALAGIEGVDIPPEMKMPTAGGSVAGGLALIVIGAVLLSNTLFGFSLTWLKEWWPVIPVGLGVWLVFRGIQEKAEAK
jgi:hypothetical protein